MLTRALLLKIHPFDHKVASASGCPPAWTLINCPVECAEKYPEDANVRAGSAKACEKTSQVICASLTAGRDRTAAQHFERSTKSQLRLLPSTAISLLLSYFEASTSTVSLQLWSPRIKVMAPCSRISIFATALRPIPRSRLETWSAQTSVSVFPFELYMV